MKRKNFILISLTVLSIFQGCSEQKPNSKEVNSNLNPLIESFVGDLKSTDKGFNFILDKYYYDPEAILQSEEYLNVHKTKYYYLVHCIEDSSIEVNFYFNEEVNSAKYYDYTWLGEGDKCSNYMLVLASDSTDNFLTDFTYCFMDNGQIYSGLSILDPSDNSTIWLRSQEEYINEDEEGRKFIGI